MTPSDVRNTSMEDVESLWLAITTIEAQDLLLRLKVADWSHMKKSDRVSLHKDWHKKAYPRDWEKKQVIGWGDLDHLLKR